MTRHWSSRPSGCRHRLRNRGRSHCRAHREVATLKRKSSIFLNETVRTAARSRLRALLARKTTLRLGAQTTVRIDHFIIDQGGELTLDSGTLLIDTRGNC